MRVRKRRLGQRASNQLNDRHLSVSVIPSLIMQTRSQLLLFHSRSDLHPGDRSGVQKGHCLLQCVLTSDLSWHGHQQPQRLVMGVVSATLPVLSAPLSLYLCFINGANENNPEQFWRNWSTSRRSVSVPFRYWTFFVGDVPTWQMRFTEEDHELGFFSYKDK